MLRLFGPRLHERAADDIALFAAIEAGLTHGDRAAIRGSDLNLAAVPARKPVEAADAPVLIAGDAFAIEAQATLLPESLTGHVPVVAATIRFGNEGNAQSVQQEGWSGAEQGYTWAINGSSSVGLPRPKQPADYLLQVRVAPFIGKPLPEGQTLRIVVNGVLVAETLLTKSSLVECEVPWSAIALRDTVTVTFVCPDAARPIDAGTNANDDRMLGVSFGWLRLIAYIAPPHAQPAPVAAASRLLPNELMLRFESIGENCEVGLVQRQCGAEPLGLLRFSSTPLPRLLKALRSRFGGMGEPGALEVEVAASGREYMIYDKIFGFRYHAWVKLGEMEPAAILARELRRVPFLVRKLVEDLEDGSKIFVFHGMKPLTDLEALDLAICVRMYGPGTVLWVECADAINPPGSVVEIAPGLLKGHVDRFAPGENAHDLSLDCWMALCRNALATVGAAPAQV